jgi:pimeloyl-ACP methyl ester carboxylesterase
VRRLVAGIVGAFALVLAGGGAAGNAATPAAGFRPCDSKTPVLCGTVVVPLDRTGAHKGTVRLHVEELPAETGSKPEPLKLLFLIAGGPGQGSAQSYELRLEGSFLQRLLPGYTLVAYDDRGTGQSERLTCPGIGAILDDSPAAQAKIVGACGRHLGARRALYSTRTNADDLDAVRQALGGGKVSLFGVSYGTKQALGYALLHPSHVARLVLDSVASLEWPGRFASGNLQAIPHALDEICRGACAGVTHNAGVDIVKLANELAAAPVTAVVATPGGAPVHVRVDGTNLVGLALDTDLSPGLAAELPASVSAGLAGNLLPLERLIALADAGAGDLFGDLSLAVNVATECTDGQFPWSSESAVASRPALLASTLASLPAGTTGRFGSWAASIGLAQECEYWPPDPPGSSLAGGHLPNVPVLIFSGGRDVRTPTSEARLTAAKFPQSRLVVVQGSGHDVTGGSTCADLILVAWLEGRHHGNCARLPLTVAPLGAFPDPTAAPTGPLTLGATVAVVRSTIDEAEATSTLVGPTGSVAGLAGGSLSHADEHDLRLKGYADVSGVVLQGDLVSFGPGHWSGAIEVGGTTAEPGFLSIRGGRITGTLGGHRVSVQADPS